MDGRPNRRNHKAVFPNFFQVVCTVPQERNLSTFIELFRRFPLKELAHESW